MTPQEAIRRIKNHNEVHSRKEKHFAIHITEALNLAVEALKKQIPKKPKNREGTTYFYCPCCDSNNIYEYCGDCGQALDWSDTK